MLDVEFYNQLVEASDALYSAGSARVGTPEEPAPAILQLRAGRAERRENKGNEMENYGSTRGSLFL